MSKFYAKQSYGARESTYVFTLFSKPMQVPFGVLTNNDTDWNFYSNDEELQYIVRGMSMPRNANLAQRLRAVREAVEHLDEQRNAEARAEQHAEGAWLRAAEAGTPDTWAEEERERMMDFYREDGRA